MTDYIATGRVVPERIASIVTGIAAACERAGVALVGGETAEHPGLLEPDEYDVAGAATGVVEQADLLTPDRVGPGDVVLGLASSGLHANGFSLVRAIAASAGWSWDRHVPELGRTLGEAVLEPTRVYAAPLLQLIRTEGITVHALSHVTGGGLAANVARVLPAGVTAVLDRASWSPQPLFGLLQQLGNVPQADLEGTLNMGVGFAAVLPAEQADTALEVLAEAEIAAWVMGEIRRTEDVDESSVAVVRGTKGVTAGGAALVGSYRR